MKDLAAWLHCLVVIEAIALFALLSLLYYLQIQSTEDDDLAKRLQKRNRFH
jgi:hypothetical protein